MDAAAYARQLKQLLPPGRLWNLEPSSWLSRLLLGAGEELARIDARAVALLEEWDPRTANETLPEWERALGIPDDETPLAATLTERRFAVTRKYVARGGQTPAYFVELAALLGYSVVIIERHTNLLLRSDEFDNAAWSKNGVTVTPNTATAPVGGLVADTLTKSAGNFQAVYQPVATTVGRDYTFSIYVKAGTLPRASLRVISGSTDAARVLDLSTGVISSGGTHAGFVSATATPLASGWWRFSLTVTAAATTTNAYAYPDNLNNAVAGTVFAAGAQFELGGTAGDYIATTGAPASNPPPHTWRIDVSPPYAATTTLFRVGTSRVGDRLFVRGDAEFEPVINRWKPAHTVVVFNYL